MEYLAVKNFSRYQHYRDRRPPWVKFYTEVLVDSDLNTLSCATRLIAALLLPIASNRDNRIPNSATWLAAETNTTTRQSRQAISDLLEIGYLTCASETASHSASNAASQPASASRARAPSRRGRDREVREESVFKGRNAGASRERPSPPLPEEKQREVLAMLTAIGDDADDGNNGHPPTIAVLTSIARHLPVGSLAKVRESVNTRRPRPDDKARYAVAALQAELDSLASVKEQ